MATVSIIVPIYCKTSQDLEWLDECLGSVEGQSDEVVTWDDGSLVDVTAILDRHPGIVRGAGDNRGVSAARNSAARLVRSELIFPVDCDDVLVPGAISILLDQWTGVPLYPDLYKFGIDNNPHYQLLDFGCEHLAKKVGIAGVGVLHSVDQWKSIGGWDEQLDFYEDGEYNARLFLQHCAVRVKQPLYGYRSHANQRTKLNAKRSVPMMRKVLSMVQRYRRSGVMGCPGCGGRRTVSQAQPAMLMRTPPATGGSRAPLAQRVAELPGAQGGKVHARYIGGQGKGKHYYQGPVTKYLYKVLHDDLVINVDPRDTSNPNDPNHAQVSLLVRITPPPPPPPPKPSSVSLAREPVRNDVVRVPTVSVQDVKDLPNIALIPYRLLVTMDIAPNVAVQLLKLELNGKARKKHISYLKRRVGSDS